LKGKKDKERKGGGRFLVRVAKRRGSRPKGRTERKKKKMGPVRPKKRGRNCVAKKRIANKKPALSSGKTEMEKKK